MAIALAEKINKIRDALPQNAAYNNAKRLAKVVSLGTGAIFGTALLYFLKLGAAAAEGFIIGATAGGIVGIGVGGYIGFGIGVALAPYTFGLSIPVFTVAGAVTGGFVGATVFGVTGGLIGLGLASGSATAVSTGVGTGVGGAIGAYVGYGAGALVWGGVVGVCAFFTGGSCGFLLVFEPAAGALGGVIGAYVGGTIGAATGYIVGKYVLDPIKYYIKGVPNGVGSAASGALAGFGHFVTGLASAAWGGAVSLGGWLLNGAIGLGSSIWGTLTGATGSIAGQIAAVAVGTTIASAATLAILNAGILTPGKFATTQTDTFKNQGINQYITVTKTASPTIISNSAIPTTITFNVTIQAKGYQLINITCQDNTNVTSSSGTVTQVNTTFNPNMCPTTLDPAQLQNISFTLSASDTSLYHDSQVDNVFQVNYDIGALSSNPPGAINCNTNFSFAVSQTSLPAIYCGASNAYNVPAGVIAGISNIEGSDVFTYTDQQINSYSQPGGKDPYISPAGSPSVSQTFGCTVSYSGAVGPMQFLVGYAEQLLGYPNGNPPVDTWSGYGDAVLPYVTDGRTPNPCNIMDSIYAAADKLQTNCGGCTLPAWTQQQVAAAARAYYGQCTTPVIDSNGDGVADQTYCDTVWTFYQTYKTN